jgi:hypothetical protein
MGLTTTLLSLGLTKPQIRTRLLLFSISAPLGAIITYMIVSAAGGGGIQVPDDQVDPIGWWTGIVLLFSVRPFPPHNTQSTTNARSLTGRLLSLCRHCHLPPFRLGRARHAPARPSRDARCRGRPGARAKDAAGVVACGHGGADDVEPGGES